MKLQQSQPLSTVYNREEDFSSDLANHLASLGVGSFEDAETESNVGTRKADIVAKGDDGILVVENKFGRADWDHWGRLEAYARLKEANVAVLVAESFEELMIVTCNLRNEDSKTDWYLIQAQVNSHQELFFHHVARPAIDVQTEKLVLNTVNSGSQSARVDCLLANRCLYAMKVGLERESRVSVFFFSYTIMHALSCFHSKGRIGWIEELRF